MSADNTKMRQAKLKPKRLIVSLIGSLIGATLALPVMAEPTQPIFKTTASGVAPMVMLTMSRDHQLFYKAYSDYDDIFLSVPGVETTYVDSVHIGADGQPDEEYPGYFDPQRCYSYDTANYFKAVRAVITGSHKCNTASTTEKTWSGNFLNWATMTRADVVRSVLYGGSRHVDTATETILQRAYLPNDAHSFAKFYTGAALADYTPSASSTGITICNTSRSGTGDVAVLSQNLNAPPYMRVAEGNYGLWAASERFQCLKDTDDAGGIDRSEIERSEKTTFPYGQAGFTNGGGANDFYSWVRSEVLGIDGGLIAPTYKRRAPTNLVYDYQVRVQTCAVPISGGYESNCQVYGTSRKPVGLLQTSGAGGKAQFGLITGSYANNVKGGVLRKHIGTFENELNLATGQFQSPTAGGIVSSLEALRITGWRKRPNGPHDNWGTYSDDCGNAERWEILDSLGAGKCSSWGNPFGEMLAESYRYFSGATTATGDYAANDTTKFTAAPGLTALASRTWNDNPFKPLPSAGVSPVSCAVLNVVALNASVITFDGNDLNGVIPGVTTAMVNTATNTVGGANGENFSAGAATYFIGNNGTLTDNQCSLKTIGNLADVMGLCPEAPESKGSYKMAGLAYYAHTNDINTGTGFAGTQTVKTYGVTLQPPQPVIQIPGTQVTIVPACSFDVSPNGVNKTGMCSLVDFKFLSQAGSGNGATGKYMVVWEANRQGGDYDQDMVGTIEYTVGATTVSITTKILASSSYGDRLYFKYALSGVNPGAGILANGNASTVNGNGQCPLNATGNCNKTNIFNLSSAASAGVLREPLYYAAKWGGYEYSATQLYPPATVPDNYFSVRSPAGLKAAMQSVFAELKPASGISGGGFSYNPAADGAGLLVQASYRQSFTPDTAITPVKSVGDLNGLWVDEYGYTREDTTQDAMLTDADRAIELNTVEGVTTFSRYIVSTTGAKTLDQSGRDLSEMKFIWSARDQLAAQTNVTAQRAYTATAGRYIVTGGALVTSGTSGSASSSSSSAMATSGTTNTVTGLVGFVPSTFAANTQQRRALNLPPGATTGAETIAVNDLIGYIRGDDTVASAHRNRTIKFTAAASTAQTWRLGDIVNSKPTTVMGAVNRFDKLYGDSTYAKFRATYSNRRHVVYVGANDGLLHAFNAGFYDAANKAYSKASSTSTGSTAWDLGFELWAYAPTNLLPHLQWLKDPSYNHVFYVDGDPKHFDVKIFTADAVHPGGWGTILVAKMRLGGQAVPIDHDGNAATDQVALRSSLVIFDVTNPEAAPVLLGEVSDWRLGFTTSTVDVARSVTSSGDSWSLVFGSGPTASDFTSAQNAYLFKLSLALSSGKIASTALTADDTSKTFSFVGGVKTEDWNRDGTHEVAYLTTLGASKGSLRRFVVSTSAFSDVIAEQAKSFMVEPFTVLSSKNVAWIYAGSGRYLTEADRTGTQTNSFYAIKEHFDTSGVIPDGDTAADSDLVNLTGVTTSGNNVTDASGTTVTRAVFTTALAAKKGWKRDFNTNERLMQAPVVSSGANILLNTFVPDTTAAASCTSTGRGKSYIREVQFYDGLPPINSVVLSPDDNQEVLDGPGVITVTKTSVISISEGLKPDDKLITPSAFTAGRKSWHEIPNP